MYDKLGIDTQLAISCWSVPRLFVIFTCFIFHFERKNSQVNKLILMEAIHPKDEEKLEEGFSREKFLF